MHHEFLKFQTDRSTLYMLKKRNRAKNGNFDFKNCIFFHHDIYDDKKKSFLCNLMTVGLDWCPQI